MPAIRCWSREAVYLGEAGHLKESPSETEAILPEQIRYYRARAFEYDEWWERRGRYDLGSEENARWFSEAQRTRRLVVISQPNGKGMLWSVDAHRRDPRVPVIRGLLRGRHDPLPRGRA